MYLGRTYDGQTCHGGFFAPHSTNSLEKRCFTMFSYNAEYILLQHASCAPVINIVLRDLHIIKTCHNHETPSSIGSHWSSIDIFP